MESKPGRTQRTGTCNKCYLCEGRCTRIVSDSGSRVIPIRYTRANGDCGLGNKTAKYTNLPISKSNREVNWKIRQFSTQLEVLKEKLTSSDISTQRPTMILGSMDLTNTPKASNTLLNSSSISSTSHFHRVHQKMNQAASKLASIQAKLELAENLTRNSSAFPSNQS